MSDATSPAITPTTDAPDKPTRKSASGKSTYSVPDLARARLRARGIKSDAHLTDECKVVRGMLRSSYWPALVKAAPASFGARGKIKQTPNDRRPWGMSVPRTVARDLIAGKRPSK